MTMHLWNQRWSKKRMVSDINFSPKFPELLLAAYTKNPSAPHEPDGLVQLFELGLLPKLEARHGRSVVSEVYALLYSKFIKLA